MSQRQPSAQNANENRKELFNFFRSGASHRLLISLSLKGLAYEFRAASFSREEHPGPECKKLNPEGLVPALVYDGHTSSRLLPSLSSSKSGIPHRRFYPRRLKTSVSSFRVRHRGTDAAALPSVTHRAR